MDTLAPPPRNSDKPCENCDEIKFPKFFCADCDLGYCEGCWFETKIHDPTRTNRNRVQHEKLSKEVADLLRQIFTPPSDPIEQRKLHEIDVDTIWFGVTRNATGLPVLQDYGRYAKIMQESSTSNYPERWPQLVSFVGQTGAGKSTLVKALVEYQRNMKIPNNHGFPTPVAGSINDHAPTSGDVHLYADPSTYISQRPTLYADCEGMDGGERTPLGAISQDHSLSKKIRKLPKAVKREMEWANNPEKCKREFAVKNFYPRLLYALSDIVVFVLRNDRIFESAALVPMLQWAAASIEGSVNQSAMPHAIIVLNFTDPGIDPSGWITSLATDKLLSTYSNALWDNDDIKTHAKYWQERGAIVNTTKDLLLCYYSTVNVVRIPQKGRYALVDQQINELNSQIQKKCVDVWENRNNLRVTFNSEEFQAALSMGFDHFSKRLDAPFDFVELSWNSNPIPRDFGGNILRLALVIKNDPRMEGASGPQIFQHLGQMVASCIMLDFVRRKLKGTPSRLIYHYKACYMRALTEFCEDWWPCNFENNRGRCVNTRRGHAKGHQDKKGSILASGEYQSTESFNERHYAPKWHATIEKNLEHTREEMEKIRREDLAIEEKTAVIEVHLKRMNEFYSNLGDLSLYMNHSVCFSCLQELPQHPLPCGHVLCINCVESFAQKESPISYMMECCPLHETKMWDQPWEIQTKPHLAGTRILTLDSGGIHAIVQVQVLSEIERHLGGISIAKFFDLIVGTGTGGIIALGLGADNWNVPQCEQQLQDLILKAFTARELNKIPVLESISTFKHKGKYKTKKFVEGLKHFFGSAQLFGGVSNNNRYKRKVAVVTATEVGQKAVLLTNYNRPSQDANTTQQRVEYQFERPEKSDAELKIWEVCRATTATPGYFKPFCNDRTGVNYIDGGVYHKNPIRIANEERKFLWPDVQSQPPDILLSIGTSSKEVSKASSNGILPKYKGKMFKTTSSKLENTEDTENTWDEFLQEVCSSNSSANHCYIRINPKLKKQPQFDEIQQIQILIQDTKNVLRSNNWTLVIKTVANRLLASSFYFEKDTNDLDENTIQGYIHCRFPDSSSDLENLGKHLQNLRSLCLLPRFIIAEQNGDLGGNIIEIPTDTIAAMIRERTFAMEMVKIQLSSKVARTTISLCLGNEDDNENFPISGFPRYLLTEEPRFGLPISLRSGGKELHRSAERDTIASGDETATTDITSEDIPSWAQEYQSSEHTSAVDLIDATFETSSFVSAKPVSPQVELSEFSSSGFIEKGNTSPGATNRQPEGEPLGVSPITLPGWSKHAKQPSRSISLNLEEQRPDILQIPNPVQLNPPPSKIKPELDSQISSRYSNNQESLQNFHTDILASTYPYSEEPEELWSRESSSDSAVERASTASSSTWERAIPKFESPRFHDTIIRSRVGSFGTQSEDSNPSEPVISTDFGPIIEDQIVPLAAVESNRAEQSLKTTRDDPASTQNKPPINSGPLRKPPKPPVPFKKPSLVKSLPTTPITEDKPPSRGAFSTVTNSSSRPLPCSSPTAPELTVQTRPKIPPRPQQRQSVDGWLYMAQPSSPQIQPAACRLKNADHLVNAPQQGNGRVRYMANNLLVNLPLSSQSNT